jgi:hypothetical protein
MVGLDPGSLVMSVAYSAIQFDKDMFLAWPHSGMMFPK